MPTALKIKAKKPGFRRAGFGFSDTEETTILLSALTKDQVAALKAEPNLLVSEIEIEAAEDKAAAKAAAEAKKDAEAAAAKAAADAKKDADKAAAAAKAAKK